MSKTLSARGRSLLMLLVGEERIRIVRREISYGDAQANRAATDLLDQAALALTGEGPYTTAICDRLLELAREERTDIYRGYTSYPDKEIDTRVAEELTEAIEAINNIRTVTA